jgi:hypothetical protein
MEKLRRRRKKTAETPANTGEAKGHAAPKNPKLAQLRLTAP